MSWISLILLTVFLSKADAFFTPTLELLNTKTPAEFEESKNFLKSESSGLNIQDVHVISEEKIDIDKFTYSVLIGDLSERYGLKDDLPTIIAAMTKALLDKSGEMATEEAASANSTRVSYCKVAILPFEKSLDVSLACYIGDFTKICTQRRPACDEACERQFKGTAYVNICKNNCQNGVHTVRRCQTKKDCGSWACHGVCKNVVIDFTPVVTCKEPARNWEVAAKTYAKGRALEAFVKKYGSIGP